jgi:antitoxin (DNA-binding transcriptional repressor) of toxin-antitoxin stability system
MRSVGIREFRDQATRLIASGQPVAIERHGKLVGFYIPVKTRDVDEKKRALEEFRQAVDAVLAESGMTEEELSQALDLSRPATN